jgi:hypothetical protein
MATTVEQAFRQFSSNLEIRDRQIGLVSDRRRNVVSALRRELSLLQDEPSKLIGSYDRHTLTRYLSEADVDVMVILHYGHNEGWYTPSGTTRALDRFKAILDSAYPSTSKRRDRNCIRMEFSEFKLDVVPTFRWRGGYYKIPDSVRQEWVDTNPLAFAEKITQVNTRMDRTFVPLIKMVKGWNREVGWPIQSFHLECMMHDHFRHHVQGYTYPSMLTLFFEALPGYLSRPSYDPVMGDRVDTYLDNNATVTRRHVAMLRATAAVAAARAASQDSYAPTAITKWKSLMGTFFPTYG